LLMLPLPFDSTAGDRRRPCVPVNPATPLFWTVRELGLEEAKAQGAICKL
jgi:hypothetical protein